MGLITKSIKPGGGTDVVAGQDILAKDLNDDMNTIFGVINGQLENINIKSGAGITGDKIASSPNGIDLVNMNVNSVDTGQLVDSAVKTAKIADAPNGVTAAKVTNSSLGLDKTKIQIESVSYNSGPSAASIDVSSSVFNNSTHLLLGFYIDTPGGTDSNNLRYYRKTATGTTITIQRTNTGTAMTGNVVFVFITRVS